jgi:hypothetical protein
MIAFASVFVPGFIAVRVWQSVRYRWSDNKRALGRLQPVGRDRTQISAENDATEGN